MDVRSPETLALAGVLFAAVAISASDYKHYGPKPMAATSEPAADACKVIGKAEVAGLVRQPVLDARALPGLDGPDCFYTLGSPRADMLVEWSPGTWHQESAGYQKLGAVPVDGLGAPAMWIPSQNAVEAQASAGRILYVAVWSDPGAPAPPHGQQLATRIAQAALARGVGPQ